MSITVTIRPFRRILVDAWRNNDVIHYNDVIIRAMICSGAYKRKHQSSASLAFVRRIHRLPVDSPPKGPATRKMFPLDDVIMITARVRWGVFQEVCTQFALCCAWLGLIMSFLAMSRTACQRNRTSVQRIGLVLGVWVCSGDWTGKITPCCCPLQHSTLLTFVTCSLAMISIHNHYWWRHQKGGLRPWPEVRSAWVFSQKSKWASYCLNCDVNDWADGTRWSSIC